MDKNEVKTMIDPLELRLTSLKKEIDDIRTHQDDIIQGKITSEFKSLLEGWKMQRDMMLDTIETIKTMQSMFIKEMNMKIGGLRGAEAKRNKPEIVAETNSIEEAIEFANIERKKLGLPPILIQNIDNKDKEN